MKRGDERWKHVQCGLWNISGKDGRKINNNKKKRTSLKYSTIIWNTCVCIPIYTYVSIKIWANDIYGKVKLSNSTFCHDKFVRWWVAIRSNSANLIPVPYAQEDRILGYVYSSLWAPCCLTIIVTLSKQQVSRHAHWIRLC